MAKAASSLSLFAHSPRAVKGQATYSPLDRSRPFFLAVIGSLITLTILGSIFYIGLRVKVVNIGYKINQQIHLKEQIIEENKRLNLEIARLKSPTRIENEAKEKLGLKLPEPHQVIYASEKTSENLQLALAKINPQALRPAQIESEEKPKIASKPASNTAKPATVAKTEKPEVKPGKVAQAPKPASEPSQAKSNAIAPEKSSIAPKNTEKTSTTKALAKAEPKPESKAIPESKKTPEPANKTVKEKPSKTLAKAQKEPEISKAPESIKVPVPVKSSPAAKQPASGVLVAKIVPEKSPVIASNIKTVVVKKSSSVRDSVPAAMLDSMP